jgi:RNA polymerase sigma-70 factor (ECF subfamily)
MGPRFHLIAETGYNEAVDSTTDEQLLADYLGGDLQAFRRLVERHQRELFQFVFRFTGSGAAAEDVVQETFLQMHMAAASFDPQRRLKPWLFTIGANKARDYLRGRTRRKEVPLDAPVSGDGEAGSQRFFDLMAEGGPTPPDNLEAREQSELVRKTIDRMPPVLREVLVMAYFHRFAYKEIAEILNIPLGTVKSRLHSAVAYFGEQFRDAQNLAEHHDV